MKTTIKLILDGENFSKHGEKSEHYTGDNPIDFVPHIGATILYKNFRQNENSTKPIVDTALKVINITYECEEDWNYKYCNKVINIIVVKI